MENVTCSGVSRTTGKRCGRRPRKGEETCALHAPERLGEADVRTFVRCVAMSRSRDGQRCGNPAIAGTTVCRYHGGAARQVKQKAALRLAALVDPAIGTLAREMVKAERSSDRQRAANSILDRAGIVRKQDGEAETARMLLVERLRQIREEAVAGGTPGTELEVIDADVVDG